MNEPPPSPVESVIGFLLIGAMVLLWCLQAYRRHQYQPGAEAQSVRAAAEAAGRTRVDANEGCYWLSVTADAIALQPRRADIGRMVDRVHGRDAVRLVDADRSRREGDRFNLYAHNGELLERLMTLKDDEVLEALEMLGWPVQGLWKHLPAPPLGSAVRAPPASSVLPPPPSVQWAPFFVPDDGVG